jgi:GT2 family glycosyltransferase
MATPEEQLPLISVVVPSFNQGHFLRDTFESIFRQGYPRLEVIVIDGGSTDGSVDVIRRYESGIKFWRSQRDAGQSAAINEGMRNCSGEVIAWLNSDDYYWNDCLWTVGKAYARYPGRGLYIGNGLRYDQATGINTPFNMRHVAMDREALMHGADFILQPATFFLREAWQKVGGLDEQLRFCMDWDIFIRIARQYPCVLINEFLGVSREYEETKTRSGKLERVFEIMRMIRRHTRLDATTGGMLYLFETLSGLGDAEGVTTAIRGHLQAAFNDLVQALCRRHGRGLWLPARTDAQDEVYLPLARPGGTRTSVTVESALPAISVVITGNEPESFLEQTLESIREQNYPSTEIVLAGTGTAAAVDGMERARGQLLVWAEAGDLLADGALRAAAREFANDPELDILYGNALHIDEDRELFLADHGLFDSAFWIGSLPPVQVAPDFHFELYKAPRPAVYFRRDLLKKCGGPNPSLQHRFVDNELFRRLGGAGRSRKLERTLALCRVSSATYAAERRKLLADLYLFERPAWPNIKEPGYRRVLRRFVGNYMRWKFSADANRKKYWLVASLAALSAVTRIGNPMSWWPARDLPTGNCWEQFKVASEGANEQVAAA